ncbi:MAG: hypothetical protein WAU33_03455 [Candidatus Binataceae bacterium]
MPIAAPHNPPFRADHVGSLLRPPALLAARAARAAGKISAAELRAAEDAAIREVIAFEEEVGLQSITDGEYRREVFYSDFYFRGLGGGTVAYDPTSIDDAFFIDRDGHKLPLLIPRIQSRMRWTAPIHTDDFNFVRAATSRTPKITMRKRGDDGKKLLLEIYPTIINRALSGRPPGLHIAMHMCRGNNQSHWSAEGAYDQVADVVFNQIDVDSYFLEYDTDRAGTFEPLRMLPKHKTAVLGLVSSKFPELESKEILKRRIDQAAKFADLDQLSLSPQCGFASTAPGNRITPNDQRAKLRRVVEVAQEVWG